MKLNIKDVLAALENDKNYLKSVPVGTIITGVYSKLFGVEVSIEKQSGYRTAWGVDGGVGRMAFESWMVSGYEENYIASRLRKMAEDNEYYEIRG